MAAVMELHPTSSRRYVSLENPRTFVVALSRRQWRDLPFDDIVRFTLDGPVLVFNERAAAAAVDKQLEIDELHAQWKQLIKFEPLRLPPIAARIHKLHGQRVALACGYTWPGNPPGHIEFAE